MYQNQAALPQGDEPMGRNFPYAVFNAQFGGLNPMHHQMVEQWANQWPQQPMYAQMAQSVLSLGTDRMSVMSSFTDTSRMTPMEKLNQLALLTKDLHLERPDLPILEEINQCLRKAIMHTRNDDAEKKALNDLIANIWAELAKTPVNLSLDMREMELFSTFVHLFSRLVRTDPHIGAHSIPHERIQVLCCFLNAFRFMQNNPTLFVKEELVRHSQNVYSLIGSLLRIISRLCGGYVECRDVLPHFQDQLLLCFRNASQLTIHRHFIFDLMRLSIEARPREQRREILGLFYNCAPDFPPLLEYTLRLAEECLDKIQNRMPPAQFLSSIASAFHLMSVVLGNSSEAADLLIGQPMQGVTRIERFFPPLFEQPFPRMFAVCRYLIPCLCYVSDRRGIGALDIQPLVDSVMRFIRCFVEPDKMMPIDLESMHSATGFLRNVLKFREDCRLALMQNEHYKRIAILGIWSWNATSQYFRESIAAHNPQKLKSLPTQQQMQLWDTILENCLMMLCMLNRVEQQLDLNGQTRIKQISHFVLNGSECRQFFFICLLEWNCTVNRENMKRSRRLLQFYNRAADFGLFPLVNEDAKLMGASEGSSVTAFITRLFWIGVTEYSSLQKIQNRYASRKHYDDEREGLLGPIKDACAFFDRLPEGSPHLSIVASVMRQLMANESGREVGLQPFSLLNESDADLAPILLRILHIIVQSDDGLRVEWSNQANIVQRFANSGDPQIQEAGKLLLKDLQCNSYTAALYNFDDPLIPMFNH